ncbi:MAG: cytochrome c3 family protein [Candidatus Aminicenantales bacterium]
MNSKSRLKLPSFGIFGFSGLVVLIAVALIAARPAAQSTEIETCGECHEDLVKAFALKPHSTIPENTCSACHGDPERHLEEGGGATIFAFKSTDIPNEKSEKCLSCHTKTNARFLTSPHGKSSLDCTTCHTMHAAMTKPSLLRTSATKSCSVCHQDVFSQFQLNERHRLQEGILGCTTCHNPHEPATRERLGGFKHEACLRCHMDKGGPFLYEHGASRIEGCTACHEVHGSPNRRMLIYQSISDLCFSCHATAPSWHSRFDSYSTNCTVCHSTIHGSNLSKIFLK